MPSIELDIIKQRSDKLIPEEKRELIEYLGASLDGEVGRQPQNDREIDLTNLIDDDLKVA